MIISSINLGLSTFGIKPAPIPCIKCDPALSPDITALFLGSTAYILQFGLTFFRKRAQPVMVPPVPTPVTRPSTWWFDCSQISLAVVL